MKYLVLVMIAFLSAFTNASEPTNKVELTGRVLGSYVSTSSGLLKGNILHLNDPDSIKKVSQIGKGKANQILLIHAEPSSLSKFAGKHVKISGEIGLEHTDAFHTDFVLKVLEITEQQ
ncbi:MAG: DUF4431 domain-containing protein [Chromatiaceae bacterium]|nr:DUF4431 domain-containing protein [Chromatiaceae bacterium]